MDSINFIKKLLAYTMAKKLDKINFAVSFLKVLYIEVYLSTSRWRYAQLVLLRISNKN